MMLRRTIPFPFQIPFSAKVTSGKRYWVILGERRSDCDPVADSV
jgi:hypothetical protein